MSVDNNATNHYPVVLMPKPNQTVTEWVKISHLWSQVWKKHLPMQVLLLPHHLVSGVNSCTVTVLTWVQIDTLYNFFCHLLKLFLCLKKKKKRWPDFQLSRATLRSELCLGSREGNRWAYTAPVCPAKRNPKWQLCRVCKKKRPWMCSTYVLHTCH